VRGLALDHRADLFAFGAIPYELLSGLRAFARETAAETMAAILNDDPPALSTAAAPIPPGLARIVDRCLEKSASVRFQTVVDLAFALEGLSDTSSASLPAAAGTQRSYKPWLGWGAAALLLVTLAPYAYQHGRELFYLAPNGKMMAVEVNAGQQFDIGAPTPLFQTPPGAIVGYVSADGKRFLLVTPVGPSASAPFTVVMNWAAGLKK
jgi:serine/threonine protein kinase